MRRLFIVILTMLAIVSLTFADDVRYVYWFDSETTQQELTSGTLDCSHLTTGLHYVHFQAYDTDGMPVPVISRAFLVTDDHTIMVDRITYWFDTENEQKALVGNTVDCSHLTTGLHYVHFQAYDTDGNPLPTKSKAFMVMNDNTTIAKRMTYWIDREAEQHTLVGNTVECSDLGLGVHHIHFQGYDEKDLPLPPRTRTFIVLPGDIVDNTSYASTVYWFDKQTTRHELAGNAIDCTGLSTGVHTVHFQTIDNTNRLTPTMTKTFLVLIEGMTPSNDYNKAEYWFDKQTTRHELAGNAIDCSMLRTGVHTVHIQLTDATDRLTPAMTQTFLVIVDNMMPTNAYSKIEYWLDKENARHPLTTNAIDCSALPTGVHVLHVQMCDAEGKAVPTYSQMFLNLDLSAHQLYYWFDSAAERNLMDIADTEISVEGLANGHHTLHAMLADAHGNVMSTEQMTADFTIVCPDGDHVDANGDGLCDVCDENFLYIRPTTAERYGTLCLPKGASAGDITGATLYSIAGKRLNANDEPISVVLEEVEDIEAGVPYIFLGTGSDLVVTYSGQAVAEAGSENGLVGSFAGQDVAEGMYLLSNNQIVKCGTGCSIGANRAYIDMDEVPEYVEGSVAPSRMRVIGLDGVTGLDGIVIEGDAVRYNLSGVRIPKGTKGITIINGKKVLNK